MELVGACVSCPASTVTLKAGIERILKDRVEGVTEVVNVGETLLDGTPVSLVVRRLAVGRAWPTTPLTCWRAPGAGDRAALARLLTIVERGGPEARAVGRLTHPAGGQRLHRRDHRRARRREVHPHQRPARRGARRRRPRWPCSPSIPSSPFSGGAILGDRVRMADHATDEGVFIRSMATRGHLGGLSLATMEAVRALDATGWPWVLIETVGVGQVEVEVAGAADTTVVVVNPGWGDAVQANKAGLLEIADVFVINKADRPGTEDTRRDLERMLDLTAPHGLASAGAGHDGRHRRGRRRPVARDRPAPRAPHRPPASSSDGAPTGSATSSSASSPRSSTSGPRPPAARSSTTWPRAVAAAIARSRGRPPRSSWTRG